MVSWKEHGRRNSHFDSGNKSDADDEFDPTIPQAAADAISEILVEVEAHAEPDEALTIGKEVFEKITSPLMIQKAAGASSSVSILERQPVRLN